MSGRFIFGRNSRAELVGVHAHLVMLVSEALYTSPVDFSVFDGRRTFVEQRKLVDNGKSWTMNSRHLTGHAVDLVPYINGRLTWQDIEAFQVIGQHMKQAAERHKIALVWGALQKYGGDWYTVNDMAHFELSRFFYFKEVKTDE